ncbi:HlyD family secretion protein [Botrimarina colliarenosi]|nr:biotin/lipoyl-binding protein [Botrimarina colliarenosi]
MEPIVALGADEIQQQFPALYLAQSSRFARRLGRLLFVLLAVSVLAAFFVPWQQSIRGEGSVVAFDPFERPQPIQAQVKGRVAERGEGVYENAYVEEGQLLFRIEDQDPQYLYRLEQQVANARNELLVAEGRIERARGLRDNNLRIVEFATEELEALRAARDELMEANNQQIEQAVNKLAAQESKLVAAEAKRWQAEADYQRKKALFDEGIESELKMQETEQKFRDSAAYVRVAEQEVESARNGVEAKRRERESKRQEWGAKINKLQSELEKAHAEVAKAEIDIQKTAEEINQKQNKLLDQERKFSVQQTQEVKAPLSGYIMELAVVDGMPVKQGDQLCRIVPRTDAPAVQVWVSGNDAPLIHAGDHTRLQFEGWPAVQFSGWPSVAVGTFGGVVSLVDPTDNGKGKFRVVVVPDEESDPWPEHPYLRQGVRANAWVLLQQVPLGYEIWRRMNGFPQSLDANDSSNKTKAPKIKI